MWPFNRKRDDGLEKRGYTTAMIRALAAVHSAGPADGETTGTVTACVNLWEHGLSMAASSGATVRRADLAMAARWLALTGNAVFLLDGGRWLPVSDYQVKTVGGRPVAYHLTLPESLGPRSYTALAGEVLHFRIGARLRAPWQGQAPLACAALSADLLAAVERSLADVYTAAPIGSQIITTPEDPNGENPELGSSFSGKRGRVLLRETAAIAAAGGPTPQQDWKPQDLTPNLSDSGLLESWEGARGSVLSAFGVLPALLDPQASAQAVREADRHLAQWQLQPMAAMIADEVTDKTGRETALDVVGAVQAYDVAGRARALKTWVDALAAAKDAGISGADLERLKEMANPGNVDM